jgi:hypothetical protein
MPYGQIAKAVIGTGASIAGGIIGAQAAKSAAKAQVDYTRQGLDWIKQQYAQTQQNFQPYIGAGQSAVGALLNFYGLPGGSPQGIPGGAVGAGGTGGPVGPGLTATGPTAAYQQFQNSPFYQFPLQQTNLATNRALAASGLTGSPGAIGRDLGALNAGYASQGFGQYMAGIAGLASGGETATNQLGQIGYNTGGQVFNGYNNMGNASAQGIMNTAAAWNGMVQGIAGSLTGSGSSGGQGGSSNSSYNQGGMVNGIMGLINSGGGGISGGGGMSSMGGMY